MSADKAKKILKYFQADAKRSRESSRSISQALGCSHTLVDRVRAKHGFGLVPRKGKDGRTRRHRAESRNTTLTAVEAETMIDDLRGSLKDVLKLRDSARKAWDAYVLEASLAGQTLQRLHAGLTGESWKTLVLSELKLAEPLAKELMEEAANPSYKVAS